GWVGPRVGGGGGPPGLPDDPLLKPTELGRPLPRKPVLRRLRHDRMGVPGVVCLLFLPHAGLRPTLGPWGPVLAADLDRRLFGDRPDPGVRDVADLRPLSGPGPRVSSAVMDGWRGNRRHLRPVGVTLAIRGDCATRRFRATDESPGGRARRAGRSPPWPVAADSRRWVASGPTQVYPTGTPIREFPASLRRPQPGLSTRPELLK